MTRYQITYTKGSCPLVAWADCPDTAHEIAERLRRYGYTVSVWMHDRRGARCTAL